MARNVGLRRQAALGLAGALLLSGCLSESGDSGSGGSGGSGDGDKSVEVMYGFGADQSEIFKAAFKDFEAKEGITIKFSSTPDFDKLIRSRVAGNNLPDIAIYPQPGITLDIARTGKLASLEKVLDIPAMNEDVVLMDAATLDGKVYAVPMSVSVKSLVWYPKKPFEDAGYTAPTSQAELLALTEQIKADGITPWCVGIESQAATGWPATDWMEDYVLRFGGGDTYDKWVKHEIPFDDPVVKEAADAIGEIWFPEGNVLGGRKAITSTNFATAGNPMFTDPPKCLLHRQASFLAQPGNFPQDVVDDLDNRAGVFALPPIEAGSGQPVMGGGDLAGLFSEGDKASEKVLQFMSAPEFGTVLAPDGGFISPHRNFDVGLYPNDTMRDIAEIAYSATEYKFDGSDLMPGEVGAGSFWRGMVEWVGGKDTDTVLKEIDDSWPAG